MATIMIAIQKAAAWRALGTNNPMAPAISSSPVTTTRNPRAGNAGGMMEAVNCTRNKCNSTPEISNGSAASTRNTICATPKLV